MAKMFRTSLLPWLHSKVFFCMFLLGLKHHSQCICRPNPLTNDLVSKNLSSTSDLKTLFWHRHFWIGRRDDFFCDQRFGPRLAIFTPALKQLKSNTSLKWSADFKGPSLSCCSAWWSWHYGYLGSCVWCERGNRWKLWEPYENKTCLVEGCWRKNILRICLNDLMSSTSPTFFSMF